MAPTLPETNGENTNKKTGSQGREDGCENKANGNAVNVGFPGGSHDHRHHQKGVTHTDIVAISKVPVDRGAEVAVQGEGPIDSCVDVAVKTKVPVDRGADVAVQSKGPIDSCVDVAVKSQVPVDRGAEVAVQGKGLIDSYVDVAVESQVPVDPGASAVVNGNVPGDIGHEFAFGSNVLIDKGAEVAVKSQADDKKRVLQIWWKHIVYGNNDFQHFYANKKRREGDCETCIKDCACERCLKVKKLLDHKKHHKVKENPETNGCRDCQLVTGIRHFHKRLVCPIVGCLFCISIKENENVDQAQAFATPVSQNETITDVITQISLKGTTLKNGLKFIEGVHYKLEGMLGQGGNGMVFGVELLEAGFATLGSKRDIPLAAKRANVSNNEMIVLKQLADASNANVAPHYFLLNKHEHIPWVNKGTRKVEWKVFEHLLFMQRAEMSLKDYIKTFPDYVLPVKVASIYFRQIVNAMVNANSLGITHNDIKAGNVLMFRGAGEDFYVAHLCDFEYARRNGHSPERRGGTEFFMPPEREDGPGRDVYALGIFFLELTIARLCRYPKDSSEWPEFKRGKVEQLKTKSKRIGILIEACLQRKSKRPKIDYLLKTLNEIGGDEGWWPVCSDVLGL